MEYCTHCIILDTWSRTKFKRSHVSGIDYLSRLILSGMILRNEVIDLVKKHERDLNLWSVENFSNFLGHSITEFNTIIDRLCNRQFFRKDAFDRWLLMEPIQKEMD